MGLICLKYLDEGCYCHSTTDYTYAPHGQQKKRKQSPKRGKRINILGVWEPKASFDYALMLGTLSHYLARLHRKTLCYSKSEQMLKHSIKLLLHYLKYQIVPT